MATPNEVTDPSDWLDTPLAALEALDHSLRCQVCKEFLNSPMITSCAHTFCSLCIRRCLSADGKCPLCRAPDQPNQLRKNNASEEAVKSFLGSRPHILKFAKAAVEQPDDGQGKRRFPGRRKRGVQEVDMEANGETTPRKTRARSRREGSGREEAPVMVDDSEDDEPGTDSESEANPPEDGLVACPICQQRMPEERVFSHLETHDDSKSASSKPQGFGLGQSASLPMRKNDFKPLPGLNYSMLTDTALRKRIQGLGIPSSGSKMLLQRRHAEWVNIWNANCDSTNPRSRRELLRDLETWEKSQNRPQQPPSAGEVMDKEFDGRAWASSHGNDFQDLIAKARGSRKPAVAPEKQDDYDTFHNEGLEDLDMEASRSAADGESAGNDSLREPVTQNHFGDIRHLEPPNQV